MSTTSITISFGFNICTETMSDKKQAHFIEDVYSAVTRLLASHHADYQVVQAGRVMGRWQDGLNLIEEPSYTLTVAVPSGTVSGTMVSYLRYRLGGLARVYDQDAIALSVYTPQFCTPCDNNIGVPVSMDTDLSMASEVLHEPLRSAVENILEYWVDDDCAAHEALHLIQQAVRNNVADWTFMNKS